MSPPGLGFASPNEAAMGRAATAARRGNYFDWLKTAPVSARTRRTRRSRRP